MQSGPPMKRVRRSPSPPSERTSNGHTSGSELPSLSLSILGVEPVDEFIKEIADFIHHTITTRPDIPNARIEVEAKIGILRERSSGQRLALPVLVETSASPFLFCLKWNEKLTHIPFFVVQFLGRISQTFVSNPTCRRYVLFSACEDGL